MKDPPPSRPGCNLLPELLMRLPIEFATARVDIDLVDLEPLCALPQVPADVEEHDDGEGEVGFEKGLCVEGLDGDVELMMRLVELLYQNMDGL